MVFYVFPFDHNGNTINIGNANTWEEHWQNSSDSFEKLMIGVPTPMRGFLRPCFTFGRVIIVLLLGDNTLIGFITKMLIGTIWSIA